MIIIFQQYDSFCLWIPIPYLVYFLQVILKHFIDESVQLIKVVFVFEEEVLHLFNLLASLLHDNIDESFLKLL